MENIVEVNNLSLGELYSGCISSFAKFVLALNEPGCDVICRDEIRLNQVFEEYGRTKIWGDQSRANLPARARGSLDDTLRHNVDLKSLVRGILERLKALLQQATPIADRKHNPARDADQDSVSSVSDSDCSTDNEGGPQRRKIPKIRLFLNQIKEQIRSLYEISSLLRRPTVTDKFIHSKKADLEASTLQGLDNIDLSAAFQSFDSDHILEKMRRWRGFGSSPKRDHLSEEGAALVGNVFSFQEMEDVGWFCRRLARANTRRREQLGYWEDHPYNLKPTVTDDSLNETALKRSDPNEKPMSVLSKQSFSTVALSDVHDTRTNIRPRTVYAPTVIGQDRAISVPGIPKTRDDEMTFPCPYCGMTLESRGMTRQLWKRHVFRDLRPYICTFQDCQSAEKLFSSRHEWKHHEFQIHRREYVCQRCQSKRASRREMSTHLQEHYGDSISLAQMNILLDLCDRPVEPSGHNVEPCILCGDEVSLLVWHDHVGAHMEDLSLFVLPASENDEEEAGGSIISDRAEQQLQLQLQLQLHLQQQQEIVAQQERQSLLTFIQGWPPPTSHASSSYQASSSGSSKYKDARERIFGNAGVPNSKSDRTGSVLKTRGFGFPAGGDHNQSVDTSAYNMLGCMTCRKRKGHCDGKKPSCTTCILLGSLCSYDEVGNEDGAEGSIGYGRAYVRDSLEFLESEDLGQPTNTSAHKIPPSNNDVPKSMRLRCMRCRERKMACDFVKPSCRACTRAGSLCNYEEARKKSSTQRGYVEAQEKRLKQVEELLKNQEPSSSKSADTS